MKDELLIECVRNCPAIYDMGHPKYLDTNYKILVWKRIAEELKEEDSVCKKRWINIRDHFRKSLNRQKSLDKESISKKYKYEEILQFLVIHLKERNSNCKLENDKDTVNAQTTASPSIELNDSNLDDSNLDASNLDSLPTLRSTRKKRKASPEAASSTLMEDLIDNNCEEIQIEQHEKHPIDAFLEGLAPTLKKLPAYYQHLARGKIFSIVHKLEGEALFTLERQPNSPQSDSSLWDT